MRSWFGGGGRVRRWRLLFVKGGDDIDRGSGKEVGGNYCEKCSERISCHIGIGKVGCRKWA